MTNYNDYKKDDFVLDEYFQQWVLESDSETQKFWTNWLKLHPEKGEVIDEARRTVILLSEEMKVEKLSEGDYNAMWQNISERKKGKSKHIFSQNILIRAAAVFIGVCVLAYGILKTDIFKMESVVPMEITSGITLELQDGSIVPLDESVSRVISTDGGKKVVTQDYHKLVYESSEKETGHELVYNILAVPYGKKFELVLSDGSHIYLNSGSRLRYPVQFLKNTPRDVYLDGEAYFTVSRDKSRPFTVRTGEMDTRVFGTKFNVSSYENDQNTYTVLVEGSVGVYNSGNDDNGESMKLIPGQRAIFEKGSIGIEEADIAKYTAWVEGKLLFTDDRFDLILKKLERHFDVEIDNQFGEINGRRFTGTFRNETLDQILKVFRAHTSFKYEKNGDKITIKK
ncbi:FecR family protein [Membranihabitans maritimus]|uniref:FecR family protein n=1 Tax=Membranihabitans maritimus TaxID=2904244 RepID=UPI001F292C2A|nr:FecR domain-containing protein [Membranihabitans maritimus]